MHSAGEGRCREHTVPSDLRAIWLAMTARGEGEPRGRHHHHHHHDAGGPGPRGGFGGFSLGDFGLGGPGGGPWRGRRKARRGDIRTAALLLLHEEPRNGYQIMQEVEERSEGAWRPSPGSVYPALAQLEDEGLIRSEDIDGRKAFRLTDAGRAHIEERDPDRPAPWEQMSANPGNDAMELAKTMREVASAFTQVIRTGSEDQQAQARKVLATARRDLYRILADGGDAESS